MKNSQQLREELLSIDRRPYPAYKSLKGEYRFPGFILSIDHVQGDPFAAPSHLHVRLEHAVCAFPPEYYAAEPARTALEDYLLRRFREEVRQYSFRAHGSGKSGLISVSAGGQEILKRSSLEITNREIIARFHVGFPANGRTINAGELEKILFDFLPRSVPRAFLFKYQNAEKLREQIFLMEDQAFLQHYLKQNGYAAFVKDGSVLPRESGISDLPMKGAVPFRSPDSLRVEITLPHKGRISGMALRRGVTLIVGGGYHGKSTLLDALQMSVYPHIAGDGREYIATDATAVKLRSEDGRFVRDVDVSMFIRGLPNGKDTTNFSTQDASGSTSQAAGIIEAIEAGSKTFLMDEDTSATNFMVRDAFMQRVIAREKEPITPFLERARDLYEKAGISTILVAGSSGAFFHIADTVIQMDSYVPVDITARAKALCPEYPLYSGTPQPLSSMSDRQSEAFRQPTPGPEFSRQPLEASSRSSKREFPQNLHPKLYAQPSNNARSAFGIPESDRPACDDVFSIKSEAAGLPRETTRVPRSESVLQQKGAPLNPGTPSAFVLPSNKRIMSKEGTVHIQKNYYGRSTGRPEPLKIRVNGTDGFSLGRQDVDLRYVEQITDAEQMEALAQLLKYTVEKLVDGRRTVKDCADTLWQMLSARGFAALSEYGETQAGLALPRYQEILSCLNRYRRD